jgi:hypothetical protein
MLLTFVLGILTGGFIGFCVGLFLAASLEPHAALKLPPGPERPGSALPARPAPGLGGSSHDLVADLKREQEEKREQDKTMWDE